MDVKDIFNQEEEDDGLGSARKRKLVPLGKYTVLYAMVFYNMTNA
jgi:hypothetical protein